MRRKIAIFFGVASASLFGTVADSGEVQVEEPEEVPVKIQVGKKISLRRRIGHLAYFVKKAGGPSNSTLATCEIFCKMCYLTHVSNLSVL